MKLLEFSNTTIISNSLEDYENINGDTLTPLVNILKENCSNCLDAMRSSQLTAWRGVGKQHDLAFSALPEQFREPADSDPLMTYKVDEVLRKNGVEARRSNSIFVTSVFGDAQSYGSVYAIFPYDTTPFSWSDNKKFKDLVIGPHDIDQRKWLINDIKNSAVFKKVVREIQTAPDDEIDELGKYNLMRKLDLISTSDFGKSEYYLTLLYLDTPDIANRFGYDDDTFIQFFKLDENAVMKDLQIRTDDFASALLNEGEILIGDKYIAIRRILYTKIQQMSPRLFR